MRALHAVATHGSVAAAAEALHVTPSGVSQQLAKLEREAGQALLEPRGRGVRLTKAGQVLAGHAERILAQVAEAKADLELLREDVIGPLRIGAIPTTVHALLPPALATLAAQHPRLAVTLHEGEAEQTMPRVLVGDLDVAVLESWNDRPTVIPPSTTRVALLSDVADLALPAGHRLAHRKAVDLSEVDDLPWIGWTAGSGCHEWLGAGAAQAAAGAADQLHGRRLPDPAGPGGGQRRRGAGPPAGPRPAARRGADPDHPPGLEPHHPRDLPGG